MNQPKVVNVFEHPEARYVSKTIQIGTKMYAVNKTGNEEPNYLAIVGHTTKVVKDTKVITKLIKAFYNN